MIKSAALACFALVAWAGGVHAAQFFHRNTPPAPAAAPTPAAPLSLTNARPDARGVKRMAVLRALDKISGRTTDINAPAGVPVRYGSLIITAQYCYTVPPEEPPETTAVVQIDENKPGEPSRRLFSGWMFASSPALNGLEHPTYDVWVITCKTDEPAKAAAPEPAEPAGAPVPPQSATTAPGSSPGARQ